jgi:Protein of unknown function (DUF1524)
MAAKKEREPWHIPNEDRSVINLEHVLPEKPEGNWPQFSAEEVKIYYRRIGNLVLLRASDDSTLKSAGFSEKKSIFKNSPYELTKQIASCDNWRADEIVALQKTLAELAVRAMADLNDQIPELQRAVEQMHNCQATFLENAAASEWFQGKPVWQGIVHIFRADRAPHGYPLLCVILSHGNSDKRRFFAVLHIPPITSPREAVRAAIVQEYRTDTSP